MLQALTNEKKPKSAASSRTAEHLPEQEQPTRLPGWMGRSRQAHSIQQRENLAALQKAYGNQAVLQMMGRPEGVQPITSSPPNKGSLLQRRCACGNSAEALGNCAECQKKYEANQTIHLARLSQHRCEDDSCPDDEPINYRAFLGFAICNYNTGAVEQSVDKEHCAGDCVKQHEKTHAADMSLCCQRASQCVNKAPDVEGRNRCRDKHVEYSKEISNWTECNAYNIEGQCLTALINQHCRTSGGPITNDCCASLEKHLLFVTSRVTQHCADALPWPCPFTEAGDIVPGL